MEKQGIVNVRCKQILSPVGDYISDTLQIVLIAHFLTMGHPGILTM